MKGIQFIRNSSEEGSATDIELPRPKATGRDILVQIEAIAMNPVDYKVRPAESEPPKVVGFDAAGAVVETGEDVTLFQKGDLVYYAGDVTRSGTNAEFQLVDERLVAKRPTSLDAASSASLPLTSLTAWEALFDQLGINPETPNDNKNKRILIIGGAGGVGSIAIQLAKLAGLIVVATASRKDSSDWCQNLGADHIINHHEDLPLQLKLLGFETVDYIANFNEIDGVWEAMAEMIAPQGGIVLITGHQTQLDFGGAFKLKSAKICWEFMFTRSMFQTDDMIAQHHILETVAQLVDRGKLIATTNSSMNPINAKNILEGHRRLESGATIGKLVLSGWE